MKKRADVDYRQKFIIMKLSILCMIINNKTSTVIDYIYS